MEKITFRLCYFFVSVFLDVFEIDLCSFVDIINNLSYPYDDNGHGTAIAGLVVDSGKFNWDNDKFPQFKENSIRYFETC